MAERAARKDRKDTPTSGRRALPSVSHLLTAPQVLDALRVVPRQVMVEALRAELEETRAGLNGGPSPAPAALAARAAERALAGCDPTLRRAINATGVVLHTGLGRAALPEEAVCALVRAASGHCTLEVDEQSGGRGARQWHVAPLLCELTGAEAAIVVNNNAGAVFLAVAALASGREVVISRGELIEIGGSFRVPDIIRASGATLVEVGTTNRTRLSDYESAISDRTALLLRCHPSNFRMVGFTEDVSSRDLAALGAAHGVPMVDDLGSGAVVPTTELGAGPSTTLREAVASGCAIVTASGDKLLGGPQAGLILGRHDAVTRIAAHPLARALRVDKLTLAALEATLRLYRDPDRVREAIPTLRYLARFYSTLATMAERLAAAVRSAIDDTAAPQGAVSVDCIDAVSEVGGGSLPGESLPTRCVRLRVVGVSADVLARRLRRSEPAIYARIREEAILFDPRTIEESEFPCIAEAIRAAIRA